MENLEFYISDQWFEFTLVKSEECNIKVLWLSFFKLGLKIERRIK